jgi:hypothetical protein
MSAPDQTERREELIIDAVTEGLSPTREAELASLLRTAPRNTFESYERAAAATALAFAAADQADAKATMPPALVERLRREADGVIAEASRAAARSPGASTTTSATTAIASADGDGMRDELAERRATRGSGRWGWLVAAAAVALLGVQSLRAHRFERAASEAGAGQGRATRWVCAGADPSAAPIATLSADASSERLVLTLTVPSSPVPAPSTPSRAVYDCRPAGD